jgi:transposase-like protein
MKRFKTLKRALHHTWLLNCVPGEVGKEARSWYVDETYVNVKGKWCYLSRAIDRDGNLVDSMLSEKRDMEAAKRLFKQAADVVGYRPARVTTDGHDSHLRAIRQTRGSDVLHQIDRYLNNRLEQDHVASTSAPTPCAGSEVWHRQRASVEPSMRCDSSFGSGPP